MYSPFSALQNLS